MRRFFPVSAGAVDDAPVTGATPALRPMLPEAAHDTALILIVSLSRIHSFFSITIRSI